MSNQIFTEVFFLTMWGDFAAEIGTHQSVECVAICRNDSESHVFPFRVSFYVDDQFVEEHHVTGFAPGESKRLSCSSPLLHELGAHPMMVFWQWDEEHPPTVGRSSVTWGDVPADEMLSVKCQDTIDITVVGYLEEQPAITAGLHDDDWRAAGFSKVPVSFVLTDYINEPLVGTVRVNIGTVHRDEADPEIFFTEYQVGDGKLDLGELWLAREGTVTLECDLLTTVYDPDATPMYAGFRASTVEPFELEADGTGLQFTVRQLATTAGASEATSSERSEGTSTRIGGEVGGDLIRIGGDLTWERGTAWGESHERFLERPWPLPSIEITQYGGAG